MDRRLWRVENYQEFLDARRVLLAEAANDFLDGLLAGAVPEPAAMPPIVDRDVAAVPGGIAAAEEDDLLMAVNEWIVEQGLPEGRVPVRAHRSALGRGGRGVRPRVAGWPAGGTERARRPPDRRAR